MERGKRRGSGLGEAAAPERAEAKKATAMQRARSVF